MLRQQLQLRERHPLHEDRLPVDLQQRAPPTDTGSERRGGIDEFAQSAVTSQGEGRGDGAVGGRARVVRSDGHRRPAYARYCARPITRVKLSGSSWKPWTPGWKIHSPESLRTNSAMVAAVASWTAVKSSSDSTV